MPTYWDPWPGKRRTESRTAGALALDGRYASGLLDVDDLAPAVLAAMRTGTVSQHRLRAARTRDPARRPERIVCPPLVAFRARGASLRNRHAKPPAALTRRGRSSACGAPRAGDRRSRRSRRTARCCG